MGMCEGAFPMNEGRRQVLVDLALLPEPNSMNFIGIHEQVQHTNNRSQYRSKFSQPWEGAGGGG
jgi:hypothetical protein